MHVTTEMMHGAQDLDGLRRLAPREMYPTPGESDQAEQDGLLRVPGSLHTGTIEQQGGELVIVATKVVATRQLQQTD